MWRYDYFARNFRITAAAKHRNPIPVLETSPRAGVTKTLDYPVSPANSGGLQALIFKR